MGKFPKELSDLFTAQGKGFFPSPEEISFSCSCPDWASMCKHVAATLYGIGARLDEDPSLFFTLRGANVKDLISLAVEETTQVLLEKAGKKSTRVIEDAKLGDMFGIDIDENTSPEDSGEPAAFSTKDKKEKVTKAAGKRKPVLNATQPEKKSGVKIRAAKVSPLKPKRTKSLEPKKPEASVKKSKASVKKNKKEDFKIPQKKRRSGKSATDTVADLIAKSKNGVGIASLKQRTGFDETKIYGIISSLKKQGRVVNVKRGVYAGVK